MSNKAAHHIMAKIGDAGCIRLHVCSTPSKSASWTLDQPGTVSGQRAAYASGPRTLAGRVIFFPINAPGVDRFQLLNLGVLGYGLELRFWVVIAIIVSLTQTITLITTLTII